MVAEQLRIVFPLALPRLRAVLAGGAAPQIVAVFEVCDVASKYEDEGQSPDEGVDSSVKLPFRETGAGRPAYTEARAELRDRETYYADLRFAVHCQSRSISLPQAALDDQKTDTQKRPGYESWDDMAARFGDTWT